MENRVSRWRTLLIGDSISEKRDIYYCYVKGRQDISNSARITIQHDMPRTYPNIPCVRDNRAKLQTLLLEYAAVHRGDGYLQGFNYIMAILMCVFKGTTHADADTWWCFARIVGLIRPLMPDFNVAWFHWLRRHWLSHFYSELKKKSPASCQYFDRPSGCVFITHYRAMVHDMVYTNRRFRGNF